MFTEMLIADTILITIKVIDLLKLNIFLLQALSKPFSSLIHTIHVITNYLNA